MLELIVLVKKKKISIIIYIASKYTHNQAQLLLI